MKNIASHWIVPHPRLSVDEIANTIKPHEIVSQFVARFMELNAKPMPNNDTP